MSHCHRELTDPLSLKVKIGSVCRKNIEKAEEKGSSMWDDISREALEAIWTKYNTHDKRRREKKDRLQAVTSSSNFIVPPISSSTDQSHRESSHGKREAASKNTQAINMPEALCTICGEWTTDYWHHSGKTNTCECRSCYRKKHAPKT
jgi:hypothetical protein